MSKRPSWSGFLRLSLVSVPVQGYAVRNVQEQISLHQLHSKCHSRIKYEKTCPIHGAVPNSEIVSGYEHAKGQYVVIEPDELKQLAEERDRTISIESVVSVDAIDPIYFSDKSYYLAPNGKAGTEAYALLHRCLSNENLQVLGKVVLFRRDELVLVRAHEHLLTMTALNFESEITPVDAVPFDASKFDLPKREIELTKTLLQSYVEKKPDLSNFTDGYEERLQKLVQAKVAGKEVVAPAEKQSPRVINLMDALRQSLANAKRKNGKAAATPAKKAKASATRSLSAKSRKSG
jgi:DNA end-binding protein Ku